MIDFSAIKESFRIDKEKIFTSLNLRKDSFKFSIQYSLLVEEYILRIVSGRKPEFVIVSAGSFSRRELSPFSDIDVMFLLTEIEGSQGEIQEYVTLLWDCGIEISHTVREFSDIKKYLEEDLHALTQFFETRFLYGNEKIYAEWNNLLLSSVSGEKKNELISSYIVDVRKRHEKYGESPKMLEPNVKLSAGGLRDLHSVEWMYSLSNNVILTGQSEIVETEQFLYTLREKKVIPAKEIARLVSSYKLILNVRNLMHLLNNHKTDRLEFSTQEKIAEILGYSDNAWQNFMHEYFEAATVINRFSNTMTKKYAESITEPISDILAIPLDEDFSLKGEVIYYNRSDLLSLSEMLRVFYYRGVYKARFEENLRSKIIESVQNLEYATDTEHVSSTFFREILKLPHNVGYTLSSMNEVGLLGIYLPEFKELVGYFQPGVYHCYTADEHTIIAAKNLETLSKGEEEIAKLYRLIKNKDILFLAVLLHDIAKPISVSGHEIIGAEIASSIMRKLGYENEEILLVEFLVRHHLTMEQIAFRRNLNDPSTLDQFAASVPSIEALNLLYLLTYADLSAVSPVIWTQWKNDLLFELYRKTKVMLKDQISGEDILYADTNELLKVVVEEDNGSLKEHIESINDVGYLNQFSQEEINQHLVEIEKGSENGVFFKEEGGFTSITVVTRDSLSLLSRLCGTLSINDINIHDAKIYTRKDGIVIDSFNVTDFRTGELVESSKYAKVEKDLKSAIDNAHSN